MAERDKSLVERGRKTRFESGEKAAESGRTGGIASGKAKRKTKTMREAVQLLMSMDTTDEAKRHALEALGLEPTNRNAATFAMIHKATNGSEKAYEVLRDTAGEMPKMQVGLSHSDALTRDDLRNLSDAELAALLEDGGVDLDSGAD